MVTGTQGVTAPSTVCSTLPVRATDTEVCPVTPVCSSLVYVEGYGPRSRRFPSHLTVSLSLSAGRMGGDGFVLLPNQGSLFVISIFLSFIH